MSNLGVVVIVIVACVALLSNFNGLPWGSSANAQALWNPPYVSANDDEIADAPVEPVCAGTGALARFDRFVLTLAHHPDQAIRP